MEYGECYSERTKWGWFPVKWILKSEWIHLAIRGTPVGNRTLIWRTGIFHSIHWTTGAAFDDSGVRLAAQKHRNHLFVCKGTNKRGKHQTKEHLFSFCAFERRYFRRSQRYAPGPLGRFCHEVVLKNNRGLIRCQMVWWAFHYPAHHESKFCDYLHFLT